MDIKALNELGDELFSKRSGLLSLWQDIGENFYVERADFTYSRNIGTDFAANLMSSYPLMCRRELGDTIGQMLRPTAKEWFHIKAKDDSRNTSQAKLWLEMAEKRMRNAMYTPSVSVAFTAMTKCGELRCPKKTSLMYTPRAIAVLNHSAWL